ncbi:MAG: HDIG domain-containing protein [Phycisphaeraceae bacterium]|nr:HDIG domain-containing protein [Phycisphaerales bacterium]QOJ17422.1 MAG: HDIG domain-containing protein [Phycisphaeraceae bacterium]
MPNDATKSKPATIRSERRRQELRRIIPRTGIDLRGLLMRRDLVNTVLVYAAFFFVAATIVAVSHDQLRLQVGAVMTEARLKRVDFTIINAAATEEKRREERARAPHVFRLNEQLVTDVQQELLNLPRVVEKITDFSQVAPEIRAAFDLTERRLATLQSFINEEGEPNDAWRTWITVDLLEKVILRSPSISSQDAQIEKLRLTTEFRAGERSFQSRTFIEVRPEAVEELRLRWREALRDLRLPDDAAAVIAARLAHRGEPFFVFDRAATDKRAEEEAARVTEVKVTHRAGDPIFKPGDILTPEQFTTAQREAEEYRAQASTVSIVVRRLGSCGVVALLSAIMAAYLVRFYPRITRNPLRVIALALLSAGSLGVAAGVASEAPAFSLPASVAVTLFASMLLVIAYDQRLAATIAGLQTALLVFALELSIAHFVLLVAVGGAAIACLGEVRHRNILVRAAMLAALIGGLGSLLLGLFEVPLYDAAQRLIPGAWSQIWMEAGLSAAAALMVGFFVLGILPSIERLFDIPTGMTLVELRDPRNPLLKQLQERAPGTYTHSLAVASIAESAADAIGANGLLTYVGALYHDIGKMNKPDYFVENQSGGPSKHDKLSPAMSLLVIVGHVKDGVELAREAGLPRVLIHFIESHHGTTLVEYFYHAARSRAEGEGERDRVSELEFRYPGPRPRTKEAAILMIADACESATRAMSDPAPAAIENLVRKLARKRLNDGQFDECELTLRELAVIEESVIRSIWSLHHGRIAYPTQPAQPFDTMTSEGPRTGEVKPEAAEAEPARQTA